MERLALACAFVLTVMVGCGDDASPAPSPPPPCDGGICESRAASEESCPTFGGEVVRGDLPPKVDALAIADEWLFATLELRGEGARDVVAARLDGTGTPRLVTTIPDVYVTNSKDIAVSGGFLYVRDRSGMQRISLPLAEAPEIVGVAAGITHLYDATPTHLFVGREDRLVRMNGKTSEVEAIDLDAAPILGDVALTTTHAYWRHVASSFDGGVGPATDEIVFAAIDGGRATATGVKPDIRTEHAFGAHRTSVFYFTVDGAMQSVDVVAKSPPVVVRPATDGQPRGAWGADGYFYFSRRVDPSSECWELWRVDLSGKQPGDQRVAGIGSRPHTIHPHGDWVYVFYSVGTTAVRRIRKPT